MSKIIEEILQEINKGVKYASLTLLEKLQSTPNYEELLEKNGIVFSPITFTFEKSSNVSLCLAGANSVINHLYKTPRNTDRVPIPHNLKSEGLNLFLEPISGEKCISNGESMSTLYTDFSEDSGVETFTHVVQTLFRNPLDKFPIFSNRFADGARDFYTTRPTHFFAWHKAPREAQHKKFVGEYFGIEIEMKFKDKWGKAKFCEYVFNSTNGVWFGERDGSLERDGGAGECGVEMVSPPHTIKEFEKVLPPILDFAVQNGGLGHEAGIFYGLHVNCNLPSKNTDKTTIGVISLVNNPQLKTFWEKIGRRQATKFCEFKTIDPETCLQTESADHYRSVFVRRREQNCIEIRIFRSTLSSDVVLATLELINLTMRFASTVEGCEYKNVQLFSNSILSNASTKLRNYLQAVGGDKELQKIITNTNVSSHKNKAIF